MDTYLIPNFKFDALQKKIKRVINKGANITFEVLGNEKKKFDKDLFVDCVKVNVEGSYKINDWVFVATLEHTKNGNIIRRAITNDSLIIPDKYKTCKPYCEHCKTIRYRKDSYLIYNEKTKEFKQVGKTCLNDFTNGLDANLCAEIASTLESFRKSSRKDLDDEEFRKEIFGESSGTYFSSDLIKSISIKEVLLNGYTKRVTNGNIQNTLQEILDKKQTSHKDSNKIKELIKEIDNYVEICNTNNDYMYNAVICWKKDLLEPRDISLIASFISTYLKYKEQLAKDLENGKGTKYVGNVGDKITFKVASIRVLYTGNYGYYYEDDFRAYLMLDEEGNTIIWKTTKIVEQGDTIVAKIVSHKEYRGTKQTIVSRGKIVND